MTDEAMDNNFVEDPAGNQAGDESLTDDEVQSTLSTPLPDSETSDDQPLSEEGNGQDDADVLDVEEHELLHVAVDWAELEGALENNSPELHSFLNNVTGDVIRVFEGGENSEVRLKQAETSPDYLYVEPISSREQYRWMEEFIEGVEEPTLNDKLNIAVDGKGAFRRFKDVLVGYPAERERWFEQRSEKLRAHMQRWLESKHVKATNLPPWEEDGSEEAPVRRPHGDDYDTRPREAHSADLRTTAHELIDLVPLRELPTAVAFLEFLRGRRGFQRNRYS